AASAEVGDSAQDAVSHLRRVREAVDALPEDIINDLNRPRSQSTLARRFPNLWRAVRSGIGVNLSQNAEMDWVQSLYDGNSAEALSQMRQSDSGAGNVNQVVAGEIERIFESVNQAMPQVEITR